MFASKPGLEFMETCPTWSGDGTFRTSTKFFAQVYFIMAQSSNDNSKFVLVVFCLLPNKRASTYQIVFESLKHCVKKGPETFLIDFEIGVKTEFETSFPETVVRGCYFHLVYNILKQVKKKGGQVELRNNIRFLIAIGPLRHWHFCQVTRSTQHMKTSCGQCFLVQLLTKRWRSPCATTWSTPTWGRGEPGRQPRRHSSPPRCGVTIKLFWGLVSGC